MCDKKQIVIRLKNREITLELKDNYILTEEIRDLLYQYVTEWMDYLHIYSTNFQGEIMSHREVVSRLKTGKDLIEYYSFSQNQIYKECLDNTKRTINKLNGEEKINEIDLRIMALKENELEQKIFNKNIKDSDLLLEMLQLEKAKAIKELELLKTNSKSTITGFKTNLDNKQKEKLYKALNSNYIECSLDDFKALFTDNPKPIKWIDKGKPRHEPNKQTIFEFFYLLNEYNYLADNKNDLDYSGNNHNNFYKKLKLIFIGINNFSNSNVGKATKNTHRKRELEKIIQSL